MRAWSVLQRIIPPTNRRFILLDDLETRAFFFGGKNRYNMGVAEDFFARPRSLHVYYARVVTLLVTNCVLVCFKATAPDLVVARMKR